MPRHSLWETIGIALLVFAFPMHSLRAIVVFPPDAVCGPGDSLSVIELEDPFERAMGDLIDAELTARFLWLREHPIDLNEATEDELLGIPGVMPADIALVQRYRRAHRPFKDVIELLNVEGLSTRAWAQLRPFVTVGAHRLPFLALRSRIVLPVQKSRSTDTAWLGAPSASYQRIVLSPSRGWECGFGAEVDAGERVKDGSTTGYVLYESQGFVRRLMLGDIVASCGLGLVWGEGLRNNGIATGSMNGNLAPHRSSSEQGFLRGIGLSLVFPCGPGEVRAHAVCSHNACSATLDSSGDITNPGSIESFRTTTDLEKRNAAHVTCIGGRIEYFEPSGFRFGSSALWAQFDRQFTVARPFELSGREFGTVGMDVGGSVGVLRGAIECALARAGAGVHALVGMQFSHGCTMHLSFRHCAPGFHSPLAIGGGYGDAVRNAREVRWNVEVVPAAGSFVQVEILQFRKPWPTVTELFPKGGRVVSGELGFRPAPGLDVLLRGEELLADKEVKDSAGGRVGVTKLQEGRRRFRCAATFTRGERWLIRGRLESIRYLNPAIGSDEYGWMMSGELRWSPGEWLTLSGRAALFQTETYDSRVYAVEADVDDAVDSTVLYGTGRRWYCMAIGHPYRLLRLALRYASTVRMIGSRRAGTDSQVSLQVDCQIDQR